jgi:hypothetical protein
MAQLASHQYTVTVDPQAVPTNDTHMVISFDFAQLGIHLAVNCNLKEVIVLMPNAEANLFVNEESESGGGSTRPIWVTK